MRERLLTVADMLPVCSTFYDICADHGQLGAYMLQKRKCKRAVLTDISENSITKARRLFARLGLSAEFVVTNGLSGLSPTPSDAIAICGVGAQTMLSILVDSLPCPALLQPSAGIDVLRSGLSELNIRIVHERLVCEGRRYYICLLVQPGTSPAISPRDAYMGELSGDPLYPRYLSWRASVLTRAMRDGSPSATLREQLEWITRDPTYTNGNDS